MFVTSHLRNQTPMWVIDDVQSSSLPLTIGGKESAYSQTVALVISNSGGLHSPSIPSIDRDASAFAAFIENKGGKAVILKNQTAADFKSRVSDLKSSLDLNSLFIVHYGGTSINTTNDKASFYFNDGSTLSSLEFLDSIRSVPAKMRVVFVDSSFAAGAPWKQL